MRVKSTALGDDNAISKTAADVLFVLDRSYGSGEALRRLGWNVIPRAVSCREPGSEWLGSVLGYSVVVRERIR